MAFYLYQARFSYFIKAGFSQKESGVSKRGRAHETAAGPQILLGTIPDASRTVEAEILRKFAPWLLQGAGRSRGFEVCTPSRGLMRIIGSQWLRDKGYIGIRPPRDPRRQTTREWLHAACDVGNTDEHVARAARHALAEYARLRKIVPRDARGGWDLNEMIGGHGFIDNQTRFGFAAGRLIDNDVYLIHRCTYRGAVFDFPVFAEWYERQHAKAAPDNAVHAGLPIWKPRLTSGRKGIPGKRPEGDVRATHLPGQLALGGVR